VARTASLFATSSASEVYHIFKAMASTSWVSPPTPDAQGLCDASVNGQAQEKYPCTENPAFKSSATPTPVASSAILSSTVNPNGGSPPVAPSSAFSNGTLSTPIATPAASNVTALNDPSGVGKNTIVPQPQQSSPGNKGLAGGAVAGIAIGMLLAGALIAGVIFFFLLRRQQKRQAISGAAYSRQHAPYTERSTGPEKGATVVAAPVSGIDDLLPQPAEDDAITGDLSKIRDNIKNHVRTYYHSGPISAADINEVGIRDIAAMTGASAAVLAKALEEPITRDNALRSIVGSVILTRCTGERSPSLLPSDVAHLSASIPANSGTSRKSSFYRQGP
jgi:hypothetical protein